MGEVLVVLVDHTVIVAVDNHAFDREPVGVIHLLVEIEGRSGVTDSMCLGIVAGTGGDSTRSNEIVFITADELCDFVLVVGDIVIHRPEPVAALDDLVIQGELDTGVAERTDVGCDLVAEVGTGCHISGIDKVRSDSVVPVEASGKAVIGEAEVETDVSSRGGLPVEVRIVCGRTIKHTGSRHRIESVGAGSLLIYGEIRIIAVLDSRSKFLLTGLTPSEAELEVAESLDILEEGLLLDLPGECEGREEGPVLTEA